MGLSKEPETFPPVCPIIFSVARKSKNGVEMVMTPTKHLPERPIRTLNDARLLFRAQGLNIILVKINPNPNATTL
jgi:hypothetical protein